MHRGGPRYVLAAAWMVRGLRHARGQCKPRPLVAVSVHKELRPLLRVLGVHLRMVSEVEMRCSGAPR